MGIFQKQGNWISYELFRETLNGDFSEEMFFASWSHSNKKSAHYDDSEWKNHGQDKYVCKIAYIVYFLRSDWCLLLWIAQSERNHYRSSLPNIVNKTDKARPCTCFSVTPTPPALLTRLVPSNYPYSDRCNRACLSRISQFYDQTKHWANWWISSKDETFSDTVSVCWQKVYK